MTSSLFSNLPNSPNSFAPVRYSNILALHCSSNDFHNFLSTGVRILISRRRVRWAAPPLGSLSLRCYPQCHQSDRVHFHYEDSYSGNQEKVHRWFNNSLHPEHHTTGVRILKTSLASADVRTCALPSQGLSAWPCFNLRQWRCGLVLGPGS